MIKEKMEFRDFLIEKISAQKINEIAAINIAILFDSYVYLGKVSAGLDKNSLNKLFGFSSFCVFNSLKYLKNNDLISSISIKDKHGQKIRYMISERFYDLKNEYNQIYLDDMVELKKWNNFYNEKKKLEVELKKYIVKKNVEDIYSRILTIYCQSFFSAELLKKNNKSKAPLKNRLLYFAEGFINDFERL